MSTYPVSETFKVVEGYDIYRSDNLIIALVVVESDRGKDLRLYRWMRRKDQWKVDLCRMSVARWKWSEIAEIASGFVKKHGLRKERGRTAAAPSSEPDNAEDPQL